VADATFDRLVDAAMTRYAGSSKFEGGMVRGKLRGDPVYRELLERGIARAARVVDLGCGKGQLLSLILAARGGGVGPSLHGIELNKTAARAAKKALDTQATIVQADLRTRCSHASAPRCPPEGACSFERRTRRPALDSSRSAFRNDSPRSHEATPSAGSGTGRAWS